MTAETDIRSSDPEPSEPIQRRARPRKVPRAREVQISRWLLVLIPLGLVAIIGGARLIITSRATKVKIASQVANEIANRADSAVRLGGLSFGWAYQPCVQQLEIYRAGRDLEISASTQEACVDRWASALGSGFRAVQIHLDRPSIQLEGTGGGKEVTSLVDVRPKTSSTAAKKGAGTEHPPLREVSLEFDDLRLDWKSLPLPERVANGSLGPIDGAITVQKRGRRSAVSIGLREPKTGLSINGRANPTEDGWDLSARLEGDIAPSFGPLLAFTGLDVKRLPLRGEIGAVYSITKRAVTIDLDVVLIDADVASNLVSSRRLLDLEARAKLRVEVDLAASRLAIRDGFVEVNGIPAVISLDVRAGEGSPEFDVGFSLKTVPLAKLLRSIPGTEPVDELSNLSSGVLFALTFAMTGQLRDPETWKPTLEHRVIGVGPKGEGSGLEYLRKDIWDYRPLQRDGRAEKARAMGPKAPGWTTYGGLPYSARSAIQISEDASFFVHKGIDVEEIRSAIVEGVTKGERTRGGSTLTQQLVKNLYLTRDRTAMRKVQELLITFLMEASLSKEQIFELYVNIIEWGPNVYGVREASQHYFGRSPQQLSPKEAAYLAAIIPGPLLYHSHYEQGYVPGKFMGKIDKILERMEKLGRIDAGQAADARAETIVFRRRPG